MADAATLPVKGARPSIEIEGKRDATLTSGLMSLLVVIVGGLDDAFSALV